MSSRSRSGRCNFSLLQCLRVFSFRLQSRSMAAYDSRVCACYHLHRSCLLQSFSHSFSFRHECWRTKLIILLPLKSADFAENGPYQMCGTSLDPTKSARPNSSPTFGMVQPTFGTVNDPTRTAQNLDPTKSAPKRPWPYQMCNYSF